LGIIKLLGYEKITKKRYLYNKIEYIINKKSPCNGRLQGLMGDFLRRENI
jgi:hypothetical protein